MSITTLLNITRDISGVPTYGLPVCNAKKRGLMGTNTATSVTAPTDGPKYLAVFSYSSGSNVWVNFNGTATVPAVPTESNDSELNPAEREVSAGQTVSLITGDTVGAQYSVLFYLIQNYGN